MIYPLSFGLLAQAVITGSCPSDTLDDALLGMAFQEVIRYVRAEPPLSKKIYKQLLAQQDYAEVADGPAAILAALLEPQDQRLGEGIDPADLRAGLEIVLPTIQAWRLLA